jgi:tetratricopeptide (TPR) repeat protein
LEVGLGSYPEALALFDGLVADRADADALTGRADTLRLLGRTAEAVTDAARAVEADPGHQEALRSLGLALQASGDTASAIEVFARVHESRPDDIRTATDLGWAFAVGDRFDEAIDILDRTVLAAPSDGGALTQLAAVLNESGAYTAAARVARHGVGLDQDNVDLWNSLGWALQYQDPPDPTAAEHAYQQSWDRQPPDDPDPWVLSSIADTHHLRGHAERATELYRSALGMAERSRTLNPAMVPIIGWCQFRLGHFKSAARAFLESSAGDPGSEVFDLALAILCSGRHERARNSYADALVRIATRHSLRRRGYLLVALADLRQAVRDWPDLRQVTVTEQIDAELGRALDDLPPVRELASPATRGVASVNRTGIPRRLDEDAARRPRPCLS